MYNGNSKEISGHSQETTNNIMELTAVIESLKLLKEPCEVDLYSDSAYVVNAFLEGWVKNWEINGWKTSGKEPVKNKELWEELIELSTVHNINWHKVKGHSDNEYNNRCDKLAKEQIKKHNKLTKSNIN
jgi:ribonuclease HI